MNPILPVVFSLVLVRAVFGEAASPSLGPAFADTAFHFLREVSSPSGSEGGHKIYLASQPVTRIQWLSVVGEPSFEVALRALEKDATAISDARRPLAGLPEVYHPNEYTDQPMTYIRATWALAFIEALNGNPGSEWRFRLPDESDIAVAYEKTAIAGGLAQWDPNIFPKDCRLLPEGRLVVEKHPEGVVRGMMYGISEMGLNDKGCIFVYNVKSEQFGGRERLLEIARQGFPCQNRRPIDFVMGTWIGFRLVAERAKSSAPPADP